MVKHAYDDPDPFAEHVSTTPSPQVLTISQRRRQKDNNIASFPSFDAGITLEFVTNEGLFVKVYKKPITKLNVDAIVNAANDTLGNYGGVADVISKAAGYDMERECKEIVRKYGKLRDAENKVTCAGNLRYKGVIHAVGPRWSNYHNKYDCLNVLLATVINILESARRNKFSTVAMPPISSGIFAVPKRMCAAMYLKGIFEFSKHGYLESLKEFHIIDIHEEVLDMIKEWYTKYKIDPACIEVSAVLKSSDSDHRSPLNRPPAWQHDERANKRKSDNLSESQRRKGQVGQGVMQARATDPRPSKTKVVPKFCGKTDILIYTGNVLQLKGIDVVVVSEDGLMKGEGGLSMALLNAGCDRYKKEHKN
ncbi:PARP10_14_15 [Mytilus edulis]|uniref:PARP10_14_15 n=1 Tax=Mytilus edulis TaxID=6550 RepID=A0A8S3TMA0_MYTED|nr:PARP10_14_15 [Mytilus edulis]